MYRDQLAGVAGTNAASTRALVHRATERALGHVMSLAGGGQVANHLLAA